jgi:hypothetical protein
LFIKPRAEVRNYFYEIFTSKGNIFEQTFNVEGARVVLLMYIVNMHLTQILVANICSSLGYANKHPLFYFYLLFADKESAGKTV